MRSRSPSGHSLWLTADCELTLKTQLFSKRPVLKPCGGAAGFRLTLGRSTDLGRRSRVQSDVVRSEIDSAHIGASDRMLLVWRVEILPPTYLGTPATDQVKPARHRPK